MCSINDIKRMLYEEDETGLQKNNVLKVLENGQFLDILYLP